MFTITSSEIEPWRLLAFLVLHNRYKKMHGVKFEKMQAKGEVGTGLNISENSFGILLVLHIQIQEKIISFYVEKCFKYELKGS